MDALSWDVSPLEAVRIQNALRARIRIEPLTMSPSLIAGADVSFNKGSPRFFAGFVVLEFPSLRVVETSGHVCDVHFPYVPGLLSFREIPALIGAYEKLRSSPDVFIFDGHGIAHPRRFGIAAHMGLILDRPALGCAKKILSGTCREPGAAVGDYTDILHHGTKIGEAVRTKLKVKPVFVSPGHRIDFNGARELVIACTLGYRLPEPTRLAHLYVNRLREGTADFEA